MWILMHTDSYWSNRYRLGHTSPYQDFSRWLGNFHTNELLVANRSVGDGRMLTGRFMAYEDINLRCKEIDGLMVLTTGVLSYQEFDKLKLIFDEHIVRAFYGVGIDSYCWGTHGTGVRCNKHSMRAPPSNCYFSYGDLGYLAEQLQGSTFLAGAP